MMNSSVIFPSQNAWCVATNIKDVRLTDQNCQIALSRKIDRINKVTVDASSVYVGVRENSEDGAYVEYLLSSLTYTDGREITELDITNYVLEYSKWMTLPVGYELSSEPAGILKNNTVYYEHKGNSIVLTNEKYKTTGNAGYYAFQSMIQSAFADMGSVFKYANFTVYVTSRFASGPQTSPLTARFRIYYTPLGDSVKLQVPKTEPQKTQFCIPYSQQQQIVNNITFGREMQSVANRTGCEQKEVARTLTNIQQYRKPQDGYFYREKDKNGEYNGDIWKLTKCQLNIYSDSVMHVLETWSKNWSIRSDKVPINREFRSWKIPAEVVQRNLLWQDYCLLTKNRELNLNDDALISNVARTELLRGLESSFNTNYTECTSMWYYTKNGLEQHGAVMPCSSFGFANSLVFSGKSKDNLSAGTQRIKIETDDENYQYCKEVYYCNADGTMEKTCIQFGSAIYSSEDKAREAEFLYPEFKSEMATDGAVTGVLISYNAPGGALANGINLLNEKEFVVMKDAAEQINFTYQLHLLTDNGFLIIGSAWAAQNPLVSERKEEKPIKVWKLTSYLPQGAKVVTGAYGKYWTQYPGDHDSLFAVDKENREITFSPLSDGVGVAVTDNDGNLLIAYNNNDGATFRAKFTHDYKSIAEALNK